MKTLTFPNGQHAVAFTTSPTGARCLTTTRDVAPDPDHPSLPAADVLVALGIDAARLAWCAQVHGARILASTTGGGQGEADALVTDRPGIVLSIRTADCVPVFLVDPIRRTAGLAHAGWRGAVAGVVARTVAALAALYGSRPGDLWAGVGPAIGPRSYEVGTEVASAFDGTHVAPHGDRWHLDLPGAVAASLVGAGVGHVERSELCTVEANDRFFSHRHEKTPGRLYSLLWLT